MYCIARPPWSAEMVSVLSSLNSCTVDDFKALWEARLWPLVMLASLAAASWALLFSFFNILIRIPVGTELRTLLVFHLDKVLEGKEIFHSIALLCLDIDVHINKTVNLNTGDTFQDMRWLDSSSKY